MGSDSDFRYMKDAAQALDEFKIPFELAVVSAHRTPEKMAEYAKTASTRGLQVIIAGAGGAAHLPGMVAAHTTIPVIGVPVPHGPMQGEDALFSIVQMPKGVPVATVAIGNAFNAGLLAAQILGHGGASQDKSVCSALSKYKNDIKEESLAKKVEYSKEL